MKLPILLALLALPASAVVNIDYTTIDYTTVGIAGNAPDPSNGTGTAVQPKSNLCNLFPTSANLGNTRAT